MDTHILMRARMSCRSLIRRIYHKLQKDQSLKAVITYSNYII